LFVWKVRERKGTYYIEIYSNSYSKLTEKEPFKQLTHAVSSFLEVNYSYTRETFYPKCRTD